MKNKQLIALIGLILFAAFSIVACSQTTVSLDTSLASSDAEVVEGGKAPILLSQGEEGVMPLEDVEVENHCLKCHTDKQTLIDTAKPEEEVISESEGEG